MVSVLYILNSGPDYTVLSNKTTATICHINHNWYLDGAISFVKGERRDNGDNLYRISPANVRLGITHQQNNWSTTIETVAYLEKKDMSAVTNELETAGYALLNIYGNYNIPDLGFTVVAGIDNLLDKNYTPHLGGVNRVRDVEKSGR